MMYVIVSERMEVQGLLPDKLNPVLIPHVYPLRTDPHQVPEDLLRNKLLELASLGHRIISVTWRDLPLYSQSQEYIDAFRKSG